MLALTLWAIALTSPGSDVLPSTWPAWRVVYEKHLGPIYLHAGPMSIPVLNADEYWNRMAVLLESPLGPCIQLTSPDEVILPAVSRSAISAGSILRLRRGYLDVVGTERRADFDTGSKEDQLTVKDRVDRPPVVFDPPTGNDLLLSSSGYNLLRIKAKDAIKIRLRYRDTMVYEKSFPRSVNPEFSLSGSGLTITMRRYTAAQPIASSIYHVSRKQKISLSLRLPRKSVRGIDVDGKYVLLLDHTRVHMGGNLSMYSRMDGSSERVLVEDVSDAFAF